MPKVRGFIEFASENVNLLFEPILFFSLGFFLICDMYFTFWMTTTPLTLVIIALGGLAAGLIIAGVGIYQARMRYLDKKQLNNDIQARRSLLVTQHVTYDENDLIQRHKSTAPFQDNRTFLGELILNFATGTIESWGIFAIFAAFGTFFAPSWVVLVGGITFGLVGGVARAGLAISSYYMFEKRIKEQNLRLHALNMACVESKFTPSEKTIEIQETESALNIKSPQPALRPITRRSTMH